MAGRSSQNPVRQAARRAAKPMRVDRDVSYRDAAHYQQERKKRSRRTVRRAVLAAVCVLAAAVIGAGIWLGSFVSRVDANLQSDDAPAALAPEPSDPGDDFYMLLLGIDRDAERAETDGEDDSLYRTDTIILAHVNPQEKTVQLVSIPRDTMVYLDGYGTQKINAAFTFGGVSLAIQTVSDLAGVPISHYALVDMDGLAAIVDSIGGVDVDLPVDVYDPDYTGLDLKAGEQHLDGTTAALLGRTRHAYDSYGAGDYYRAANQRMLIAAIADKVLASDAFTIMSTIETASEYVETDYDVASIVNLALWFQGMDPASISSALCPTEGGLVDGVWYEQVDEEAWARMMERVEQGLSPYESEDEDPTAGVAGTTVEEEDAASSETSADEAAGSSAE